VFKASGTGFIASNRENKTADPIRRRCAHADRLASGIGGQQGARWTGEAESRRLSGHFGGDFSFQSDPATGSIRIAIVQGGLITALSFPPQPPVVLSRTLSIGLIEFQYIPAGCLAGRSASDHPIGRYGCACFNVAFEITLLAGSYRRRHPQSPSIREVTLRGTNCGSASPSFAALLETDPQRMARRIEPRPYGPDVARGKDVARANDHERGRKEP